MPRNASKTVRLYQPALSRFWWIRFTLPPHVARHFKPTQSADPSLPLSDLPNFKPDKENRVSFSLKTEHKPSAEKMQRRYQTMLDRACDRALDHKTFAALTGASSQVTRTVEEFFEKVKADCAARVAIWKSCTNPIEAKRKQGLNPHTAHDYQLVRDYFIEFLAQERPDQTTFVHDVGMDADCTVHLSKFKHWFYLTRQLGSESWSKARGHLSWAWQHIAIPNKLAPVNPWSNHDLAPMDEGEKKYPTATEDQRRAILNLSPSRDHRALKLLLITGRRVAELSWLQRGQVDEKKMTITWTISKKGRSIVLPLTPMQAEILREQMDSHNHLWVFPRADGHQCLPHYLQTKLGRTLASALDAARCPLPCISPQSLRRTWQTRGARQAKASPHDIRDLMAHKSVEQQTTYIQDDVESLRATAAEVERQIVNG